MSHAGTLAWFARHEVRLGWRDWLSMMTAGRRRRTRTVAIGLVLFALFLHLVAFFITAPFADVGRDPGTPTLVVITGTLLLSWSLMLSQAMESVTRAFYARADLDLIVASPVASRKLFAVRIGAMALSTILMATLLAAPFINVLAARSGLRWLAAYGIVAAMGLTATAAAVALTVALFRTIGPKRTRLVAQIVAAVIGAAFVIGLQVGAILSFGTLSRTAFLQSDALLAYAPAVDSLAWWPARAVLGDAACLAAVLAFVLLPGTYAIVRHLTLYDSIRHMYFIIPPFAVLAAAGWDMLLASSRRQIALVSAAAFAVGLAEPVVFQIRNHPNQTVYFSPLAGGPKGAFGRYDMEQSAGGNPTWNTGVNYGRQLAESGLLPQVAQLYRQAGGDRLVSGVQAGEYVSGGGDDRHGVPIVRTGVRRGGRIGRRRGCRRRCRPRCRSRRLGRG